MITTTTLILATLLGYLLNYYLINVARKLQTNQDDPHARHQQVRWASGTKPRVGGWAFFLLFLLGIITYLVFPFFSAPEKNVDLLPLFLIGSLSFGMGLSDDALNLRPWLKLSLQLATAGIMIVAGVYIPLFDNLALDAAFTCFWVVGIMNSVNMLDNMDGITGSVTAGILFTLLVFLKILGLDQGADFYIILCVLGALTGFLLLNLYPSQLYMGDSGSQFLGAFLAFLGIKYLWALPQSGGELQVERQFLMAVLVFLMPIMDTTFVTVGRLIRGKSPFKGGRDHITHHMVYMGIPEKFVPLVTVGVTLVSGVMVLSIQLVVRGWSGFHTLLYGGYLLGMFGLFLVLYLLGERNHRRQAAAEAQPKPSAPVELAREQEPVALR
jgi:UDP-GlcNAc:undecaprenyl-phosphate GlcNAc-1-phosphate transferase